MFNREKPASQSVPRGIKTSNQQRPNQTSSNEESQTDRIKTMRLKLMSHRIKNRSARRELPPITHKPMTFSPPNRFFSDPRVKEEQEESKPHPYARRKVKVSQIN